MKLNEKMELDKLRFNYARLNLFTKQSRRELVAEYIAKLEAELSEALERLEGNLSSDWRPFCPSLATSRAEFDALLADTQEP